MASQADHNAISLSSKELHALQASLKAMQASKTTPAKKLRHYQDCVDMLSAILEVSENFDISKDGYKLPSNSKARKKLPKIAENSPLSTLTILEPSQKKPKKWLQKRLVYLLEKAMNVYVNFMFHVQKKGDLSGLVGGGHAMAPLQLPLYNSSPVLPPPRSTVSP